MKWLVYNFLFAVIYTAMLPHYLLRMKKRGGYSRGFMQRLARYDEDILKRLHDRKRIWIHAVSVGEVYVALKFMEAIRERSSNACFVLSTNTSTAHAMAEKKLNKDDVLLYFPADFPGVVSRALTVIKPSAILLTECELWPNLIRMAKERKVPVVLINGRISKSSYSGYSKLKIFTADIVKCVDLFLVQTEQDKDYLKDLGADDGKMQVMGTAKYDVAKYSESDYAKASEVLNVYGMSESNRILLGGSTWPGEEKVLLDTFKKLKVDDPLLRLVLVPRHMERRSEVEREIRELELSYAKRSGGDASEAGDVDVLLVDTTGELKGLYACADLIFVGKSLMEHGGQNIIEPAILGKPILVGPNMENFPVVIDEFMSHNAIVQVKDAAELSHMIEQMLLDDDKRCSIGKNAFDLVHEKMGVVRASVDEMSDLIC